MKNTHLIIFSIVFLSFHAVSQKAGYEVKVKLTNGNDSILYLWSYFGSAYNSVDTAHINKKNLFIFSGKKSLDGGIYLVVNKDRNKFFELLIDKEQFFEVSTTLENPIFETKITGSREGSDFYEFQNQISLLQLNRTTLETEYKLIKDSLPDRKKEIEAIFEKMNKDVIDYKLKIAKEKSGTFLSIFIKAQKEPEIPKELPIDSIGKIDSSFIYRFYKSHFFDDFDFADSRILRTPIYASKVKKYYTQVLLQSPDSLIREADEMIAKAKGNLETYKFCIWYFTYEAEISNIMGIDAVFVHLVEKYYETGEAYWATETLLNNMIKRKNTLKRLLIGAKAPNMIMIDTNNNLLSLNDIKANYTIILFWSPDCGHCKAEIPKVRDWNNANYSKYGIKIFSVCADTNLVVWKKYIEDSKMNWINVNGTRSTTENYHDLYDIISTPTIYLLDKNKKIIAKKLSYEQLIEFIERDFEINSKK